MATRLNPAATKRTPTIVTVQTGALKLATLHRYVPGYGTVEPAPATAEQPAASAQLAAPSAGVVARVNVVAGQQVAKGDVLVELNSGATTFVARAAGSWIGRSNYTRNKTRR